MVEKDALVYLGPEKFITRRAELQHKKPSKELSLDAATLIVKDKHPSLHCATNIELEVVNALRRRSLAFDLVKLVSYDEFNAYCSELVDHLSIPPPPGYSQVTVQQILRADRAAFLYMAEKLTTLKRDALNHSPLERMLGTVLSHSAVSFHLLPLPQHGARSEPSRKKAAAARKRDRAPSRDRSGSPPIPIWNRRKASKGKGRGKSKKGGPRVPEGLLGKALETPDGRRLCWAFNLRGCEDAAPGQSCRSFMWDTTPFVQLLKDLDPSHTTFHHCRYGSARRKLTRLVHNIATFHNLEAHCQNDHEHEPWGQLPDGRWATGDETAYPWDLCRTMAFHLAMHLQTLGALCVTPSFAKQEETIQALRESTDIQQGTQQGFEEYVSDKVHGEVITVGIHRSPKEFIQEALIVGHPTEVQAVFPSCIRKVVDETLSQSHESIARKRTAELRRWATLIVDLKGREGELRSSMSQRRSTVLKDKKLALFEKLIVESGHQDVGLIHDLTRGFDLTGELPKSGVFDRHLRPAKVSCDNLRTYAKVSRDSILKTVNSSGEDELDRGLWEATLKEVSKGFLEGPVEPESMPPDSLLTKRFPVRQKNKIRPIDDYKANMVNQSATHWSSDEVNALAVWPSDIVNWADHVHTDSDTSA
eukprot:Skav221486  [mRNA]  locus=scaffold1514:194152:200600:- [translate_table: standard]